MDIVFDVDGTLMNIEHRVKYARKDSPDYDYEKFEAEIVNDTPNIEIFTIAHALKEQGHTIIIASGRKAMWTRTTLKMLDDYFDPRIFKADEYYVWGESFWDAYYFRKDGDNRKDSIVKEEMYEQMLKDGYDPKLVFDDRQQVVDMWRSKGIRVCQVSEGNF